jgi:ribonuclease HI
MKKRRILYVDATITGNITKISLYDSENNLTNILELIEIKDNNIAELYAVLYAILYVIKNNLSNCHILSDNSQAVQNKEIIKLCKSNKIGLSWIPREINVVADRVVKLEPTVKIKEWYILNFFYEILFIKE